MTAILTARHHHATVITLNRPDKRNALTAEMLDHIATAIAETRSDVLILTGAGAVFSAGADLAEMAVGLGDSPLWEAAGDALSGFAGLSIAALNGTLAGGAFGLALACDIRVAAEKAQFFYPVIERGYLPRPSDARRLNMLIGPARSAHLLLTAARWDAATALHAGLINAITDDPLDHALTISAAFARNRDVGQTIKTLIGSAPPRHPI